MEMGYAVLDMSEQEFDNATPRFFCTKLNAVLKLHEKRDKQEWERARYIAQRVNTPYMKRTPADWWKLPWDGFQMSVEDWREFNKLADSVHKQKLN